MFHRAVDEKPIYPGCGSKKEPQKCFIEKIGNHLSNAFDRDVLSDLSPGINNVALSFIVDRSGAFTQIMAKAPADRALEKEIVRALKTMPRVIPAIHQGKTVNCRYILPITLGVRIDDNGDKRIQIMTRLIN